jgi:hypothetical protein
MSASTMICVAILLTLEEQRQEGDTKYQENGNNASPNPIEHRDEVVAAGLATNDIALRIDSADQELFIQRSNVEHCERINNGSTCSSQKVLTCDHEDLNGIDNKNVVDVETWVTIVEG